MVVPPPVRDAELTRQRIVAAARTAFADLGYEGATVRGIAAKAGVAPNLVTRYFTGKEGLFLVAARMDLGVRHVLPGPHCELGARIAARVVARWESAGSENPLLILMRAAAGQPMAARALAEFFQEQAALPLLEHLQASGRSPAEANDRVVAVTSLIMGVITARYVMAMGPLVNTPLDGLQAWFGSSLQRLLDADDAPRLVG